MKNAMRKISSLFSVLLLLTMQPAGAQDVELMPPPPLDPAQVRGVMEKAVNGFIRPAMTAFANRQRSWKAA